ncbi:reverse transcriptase family protein [Pseudoalteromonas sp. APAL1]|uniref:reverse transcriptase family protein n=1 Tax=Pseudoalteromonas sp. APAL1 TaxID=2908883 RepID=UPI001F26EE83|nr:reverse transcriptase family protein [Pseudoalteromonas sp. APAL1]MCF2919533.1 reverse transcriptase family protein [Pseudoalteromonas sp. APAL1]
MDKIDKDTFFSELLVGDYSTLINQGVPQTDFGDVTEIQSGKKFFYKLKEDSDLNKCLKVLTTRFLNKIPINNSAKAFRSNQSYLNFIEPHRKNYHFIRIDIKNFFHSISEDILKDCFSSYFEKQIVNTKSRSLLVDSFINLVTLRLSENSKNEVFSNKIILPIGYKTSPIISNIIFRKFDILIQSLCSMHNIEYTRYADDLLFSSPKHSNTIHSTFFYNEISFILSLGRFKINQKKLLSAKKILSIKGYTIDGTEDEKRLGTIRISNKKIKIIEKLLYEFDKGSSNIKILRKVFKINVEKKKFKYKPKPEFIDKYAKDQVHNKTLGYRSYLISLIKFNQDYKCIDDKSILKYLKLVKRLEKLALEIK